MSIKVYKFGGASVKDADGMKNVAAIIQQYNCEQLVVVVSASGKTTNHLEQLIQCYFEQNDTINKVFDAVKQYHLDICKNLFPDAHHAIYQDLDEIFAEIEWILEDQPTPNDSYDYVYDQVVSMGEMLSSRIFQAYLNEIGLKSIWMDARDFIKTDNTYREAKIQWNETLSATQKLILPNLKTHIVVTQGFIGCTSENFTTTLGREGSDYTGAILAWALDAESETIWKDVPGVLNADPRLFNNTIKLDKLSYTEAIEMTYYGAQVIHPKTIQPLQNKHIPLHVRSFISPEGLGTIIDKSESEQILPPIIVLKKNQIVLHVSTRNFSFVTEDNLGKIFTLIAKHKVKVNMMQQSAIRFSLCCDYVQTRIDALLQDLETEYFTQSTHEVELLNLRHGSEQDVKNAIGNSKILMRGEYGETVQLVLKQFPTTERL